MIYSDLGIGLGRKIQILLEFIDWPYLFQDFLRFESSLNFEFFKPELYFKSF